MDAWNITFPARRLYDGHENESGAAATGDGTCRVDLSDGLGATPLHMSSASEPSLASLEAPIYAAGGTQREKESQPLGGRAKRLLDIVVASTALLLASPVMLIIAVLILVRSGGPVIFVHRRIGFNGKQFNCYKFRTMTQDADRVLEAHLANDPEAAKEWRETFKLKRDPRVTLLGQILRVSSLDELPQLFNVLRGDMSCVGPRPIVEEELQRYGAASADYLRTRPGVTGLWQVTGRSSVDYAQRVLLDSHYVRNWSLGYDFLILLRTLFAVLRFDRAA